MDEQLLAGKALKFALKDEYEKLLGTLRPPFKCNDVSGFTPIIGLNYKGSRSQLLVCGRAVNGWRGNLNFENTDAEIYKSMCNIHPKDLAVGCEMNWIKRAKTSWDANIKNSYNHKRSSFWNGIRDVLKELEGDSELDTKEDWPSLLAWSNVYKISPADKGNPNSKLRRVQIPQCKVILQKEIEFLRPKNILFITGNWGIDILKAQHIDFKYTPNKTVQFAEKVDLSHENNKLYVNAVVTVRPEAKKRNLWVKDVVSEFRRLNEHA